jgi:hypothetical protein
MPLSWHYSFAGFSKKAENMATENNNKNQTTQPPQDDAIRGRIYNSQNPELDNVAANADISAVDQQEGTMNNGETGVDNSPEKE